MLDVKPENTFADFACGSGGFLVHRNKGNVFARIKGLPLVLILRLR